MGCPIAPEALGRGFPPFHLDEEGKDWHNLDAHLAQRYLVRPLVDRQADSCVLHKKPEDLQPDLSNRQLVHLQMPADSLRLTETWPVLDQDQAFCTFRS